jgi:uncharacterized protein (DUF2235 family)
MLIIKGRKSKRITNLHGTAHARLDRGRRNTRNAHHDRWDVEDEVISEGVGGVGRTENTEGVASRTAVVALGRSEGRGTQELHLAEEADWSGEAADGGLDGLAHITEDKVSWGSRSGNGGLESSRGSSHVARWVVADGVAGRGVELVAISGWGSGNGGSAVVRAGRGDLANETSNR